MCWDDFPHPPGAAFSSRRGEIFIDQGLQQGPQKDMSLAADLRETRRVWQSFFVATPSADLFQGSQDACSVYKSL